MDYEFTIDQRGKPIATFSTEQALVGLWFSDEIGDNLDKCQAILDSIEALEIKRFGEKVFTGQQHSLTLTPEEVIIIGEEAQLTDDQAAFYEEDFETEESASGLEDFKLALLDWKAYISD